MNLNLEVTDGLRRCLSVRLSEQYFRKYLDDGLQSLGKTIEIDGLSDIKAIEQEIMQQLGQSNGEQLVNRLISGSFEDALEQLKLDIAGKPVFQWASSTDNNAFEYQAEFEIYPEINLPDLSNYRFTRFVAEVSDEDVDRAIRTILQQQSEWRPVERPANKGDSVIVNYRASHGDRVFDGADMRIELSGDELVSGFEQALTGVRAMQKLSVPLTFPEDHYQQDIAGKTVVFDIEVVRVEGMVLPELDQHFIKSHGVESGSVKAFREAVRHNMDDHLRKNLRIKNTLSLFTEIINDNNIEIPENLLKEEITRLTTDPCEEIEGVRNFKHKLDPSMFTNLAQSRVSRSLLVSGIASANDIQLDTDEVHARLVDMVKEYYDSERVVEWFYEDKTRLAGIESDVLGEQVADWIMANNPVETVITTYSEIMGYNS